MMAAILRFMKRPDHRAQNEACQNAVAPPSLQETGGDEAATWFSIARSGAGSTHIRHVSSPRFPRLRSSHRNRHRADAREIKGHDVARLDGRDARAGAGHDDI